MRTVRIAPVGSVLQSSASAPFPPASFAAMMPEPTTAASRNAVPKHSAAVRCASDDFMSPRCLCRGAFQSADFAQFLLQAQLIERAYWQRGENADPLIEHPIGILERQRDFGRRTLGFGRVRYPPMRRHWLTGPDRAGFTRRVVADREYEIEQWRSRIGKFAPGLRAKARRVITQRLQEPQRLRMHPSFGLAAGAKSAKFPCAELVQDRFGHDRSGRVSGTQEQYVEGMVSHLLPAATTDIFVKSPARADSRCGTSWLQNSRGPSLGSAGL